MDLTSREYHNKKLNEIYESVKSSQKKILSLLYTLWRDDAYNKIIKILKEHPSFAKIKLGGTPIKDSSAYNLADLIATNDRIKYIDIEACELIGSEGLIAIFKSLSKNTTLEVLAIDRVGIDQVVCEELIDQLRTNFTLKSLQNLTRDGVGEIYLDQNNISKDLNNKIRSLLTRNNKLSDA